MNRESTLQWMATLPDDTLQRLRLFADQLERIEKYRERKRRLDERVSGFLRDNPDADEEQIKEFSRALIAEGLYSKTTFTGDIELFILHRARRIKRNA